MALENQRWKGVVRKGKVELEPGAEVPEGAEVIVLFEEGGRNSKEGWEEAMRIIESFRGRLPVLPDSAYTTESLYD